MNAVTTILVIVAGCALAFTAGALLRGRPPARRQSAPVPGGDAPGVDEVTGLESRLEFERLLAQIDPDVPIAIAMLDLDHVADFIDNLGRSAADAAIVRIASTIRESMEDRFGPRVRTFRTAPDEFAVVMPRFDPDHAVTMIEGLRDRIADSLATHERLLSVSCGIACYPQHFIDEAIHGMIGAQLVGLAIRALHYAKSMGGARTVMYDPGLLDPTSSHARSTMLYTTAKALAAAVDAKDAYTHAHSQNVSDLAQYVARTMGLDEHEIAEIALGGLLHDVGKIGVSDQTLKKSGKLTDEEWEEIKSHCEIGYEILSGIEGIENIKGMVLYHHERPDGTGYPYGLPGPQIPMAARIIGVADAFDSMTAERVYQKARSPEEAIAEIVRLRGKQFDAHVVDALCDLMVYEIGGIDDTWAEEPPEDLQRAA